MRVKHPQSHIIPISVSNAMRGFAFLCLTLGLLWVGAGGVSGCGSGAANNGGGGGGGNSSCGNGVLETGEECDDGNPVAGDGCNDACKNEFCGDGVVNNVGTEVCDDGNTTPGDGCNEACQAEFCGDGVVNNNGSEGCDDGNTDDTDACPTTCQPAACGDGFIQAGVEVCDDGNTDAGDGCSAQCAPEVVQITAGLNHTCVLLEQGNIRCWGEGLNGKLGYSGTDNIGDTETPAAAGDVFVGDPGDKAIQVEAGEEHTCALFENGNVRCWGKALLGALGYGNKTAIGDNENPLEAGDVDLGGPAIQIAAGGNHTCALLEGGTVRCWGSNSKGQLGYANTSTVLIFGDDNGEVPSAAGDVDVGGTVVQIAAGSNHTCALLDTGNVRCWGFGLNGELGYGNKNNIGDDETPASAGDVPVGGTVVQITAGGSSASSSHTCALLDTGKVRCWGAGGFGRLGYGSVANVGDNPSRAITDAGDVDMGGVVTQISAGASHTCALLEGGTVRCWGGPANEGKLGYGNTTEIGDSPAHTIVAAGDVPIGGTAVQVAAGGVHTCVIIDNANVRCWGTGDKGQLGYPDTDIVGDNETPEASGKGDVILSAVDKKVTQVEAGGTHTCAVLETGHARCWGDGGNGRLGYGNIDTIGDNENPSTAGDINVGDGEVVQKIVGGGAHTCALLKGGRVRCWGFPGNAQTGGRLGYGNLLQIGDDEDPAAAGDVDVGGVVTDIDAGSFHTCAVLNTGAVRCWGVSDEGELGYGNKNKIGDDEAPATAGDVNVGGSVTQIALGDFHTCALLDTGKVRCWGFNDRGQLGYGNSNSLLFLGDDEVPATAGDVDVGGTVTQITAGSKLTCALLDTGNVRCWGLSGGDGRLGYGRDTGNIGDDETPASAGDVNVGGTVAQISAGQNFVCALLTGGTVRCWGSNASGALGYANSATVPAIGDDEDPATAGDVDIGGTAVQISAGTGHVCALLDTGKVRCWGEGGQSQLGLRSILDIGDDEPPASAGDVSVGK